MSNFDYEKEILNFWKKNKIDEKVSEKNKKNKVFSWVEGPPYPTGEAHLGHLRNWAIKDSVFRFNRFIGKNVYTKDGYDVHGLPVEQKVQAKLGLKGTIELKEFGEEKFVEECRKYVDGIINDMKQIRERYGLSVDLKKTYVTSHPDYISNAWRFFKKAEEKELLYKDYRCVAWSPALETTLSDYEIKDSYANLEDPSVYVRFKIKDEFKTTSYDEYLLIWTTTPWTLEANQAINVNKDFNYSKVLVNEKNENYVLVIGEGLEESVLEKLQKKRDIVDYKIIDTFSGEKLIGIKYNSIYPNNETQKKLNESEFNHKVYHADFISLGEGESHLEKLQKKGFKHESQNKSENLNKVEDTKQKKVVKDGTGLAHQAPAHGIEDFDFCREVGIKKTYCVVNEKGLMIDESLFSGMNFRDANSKVIEHLEKENKMLLSEWKKHNYPLCWRSKVPIVYRTTEQWYIKRSYLIDEMIENNNQNVTWHPNTARASFNNAIKNSGDWAISRQRFWGTPIPIFENIEDKKDYIVVSSKDELEELSKTKLDDVHLSDLKNLIVEKNGNKYKHTNYICDVWFDSGCASFASHYEEGLSFDEIIEKYYPMDWITEGEDQIRGWFSSLFNVGYMVTNKAPYKNVLFYRYVMDKNGQKMSKSLGNGISGNEAIEKYGADRTRFYLLNKIAPEEQLNFDEEEFKTIDGFFNTLKNAFKYASDYLDKNSQIQKDNNLELKIEDKWILYKLNNFIKNTKDFNQRYRFNLVTNEIFNFVVNDFSKTYLKIVKDRCEIFDKNLAFVFEKVLKDVLVILSISTPFLCEKLYNEIKISNKKDSIFLEDYPNIFNIDFDENKEKYFSYCENLIQNVLNLRERAKIGLRWPLQKIDIILNKDDEKNYILFDEFVKKLINVKTINYSFSNEFEYDIKPNFLSIKEDFSNDKIKEVISKVNSNKEEISNLISNEENNFEEINLKKHILKEIKIPKEFENKLVNSFSNGIVVLDDSQNEELLREGFLREIIRKVQNLRKDLSLKRKDNLNLKFGGDDYLINIIENNKIEFENINIEITQNDLKNNLEFSIKDKKLEIFY